MASCAVRGAGSNLVTAFGDNDLVRIRAACVTELPSLQSVDRAAVQMFGDIGTPEIADHHTDPYVACQPRRADLSRGSHGRSSPAKIIMPPTA